MKTQAQIDLLDALYASPPRPCPPELIKSSRVRLILAGETFERYEYQEPYFYNVAPDKRSEGERKDRPRDARRRLDNLRRVRQRIRRLVAANVSAWGQTPKFVTYTFSENVTSLEEANRLWNLFTKRLSYELGSFKSLTVVEFQRRGAVHYHTLYFSMPFVASLKPRLAQIWGHGFVNVKGIKHVHNVSAYVVKYLQKDLVDSRLSGRKAYFGSRGLRKPVELRDPADVALAESRAIMSTKVERVYSSSHFGRIRYTQGVIVKL